MADNLGYSPGSGANIATDDVAGVHYQKVKLDLGGDGVSVPAPGDAGNGLDVDVTRVQGTVDVADGGASLTVDSPQLPPALVNDRLDVNIGAAEAAVPVTDNSGSLTVDSDQLPASLTAGGNLKVAIQESEAVPVTDDGTDDGGSLSVDDNGGSLTVDDGGASLTVDGTVAADQGEPAANANAWPVKVSDGTDTAGLSTVGSDKALKVDVVQSVEGAPKTDKGAFTEGADKVSVIGGVLNETPVSDPAEDQAAAARITAKRGLHVNLRNNSGTELGVAGAPLRVDPTGSTTQPVSGTVAATLDTDTNAGAAAKKLDYDTGPPSALRCRNPAGR